VAKKGRDKPPPSEEQLRRAIRAFASIRDLESDEFRGHMGRLVRALHQEVLALHRDADRLAEAHLDEVKAVKMSRHLRGAIIGRLRRDGFESRHLVSVDPDGLADQFDDDMRRAQGQLRKQAAVLLRAADDIDNNLTWYAEMVAKLRVSKRGGRPRSVATHHLMAFREECGGALNLADLARGLDAAGLEPESSGRGEPEAERWRRWHVSLKMGWSRYRAFGQRVTK
jgi:hypothetical protein